MKEKPTQAEGADAFVKRELHGTTFLSLEYVLHKILLVFLGGLLVAAACATLRLWVDTKEVDFALTTMLPMGMIGSPAGSSLELIMLVAAIVVAAPLVWLLQKRTQAELAKRPAFTTRLAYKLPLYGAIGTFFALKFVAVIGMLMVVLYSLAALGQSQAGIADMYRDHFVPALIAALVFAIAEWQLVKEAKGRDTGRSLTMVFVGASLLLAVVLFVSATMTLQDRNTYDAPTLDSPYDYLQEYDDSELKDLFKY